MTSIDWALAHQARLIAHIQLQNRCEAMLKRAKEEIAHWTSVVVDGNQPDVNADYARGIVGAYTQCAEDLRDMLRENSSDWHKRIQAIETMDATEKYTA